jgi:type IV pilus assembly protein PilF
MRIFFCAVCLFFSLSIIADPITAAKIHAKLGLIYLSQGFYPRAKTELLLAMQEDTNHASSWYSMAYYLEKTGDTKAAGHAYQKALQLEPHSGEAKNNYAAFLCREKSYQAAIVLFLAAAKELSYLNPANAYDNAGLCALKMKDNKSAKKYFDLALLHDPYNKIARVGDAINGVSKLG